eukprot:92273-Prymnesium_polylepis.1
MRTGVGVWAPMCAYERVEATHTHVDATRAMRRPAEAEPNERRECLTPNLVAADAPQNLASQ